MNDQQINAKVIELTVNLQYIKEQLPAITDTINELVKTTTTHSTIIDVTLSNIETLKRNIDTLLSIQQQLKTAIDDIDSIYNKIEVFSKSIQELELQLSKIKDKQDTQQGKCSKCFNQYQDSSEKEKKEENSKESKLTIQDWVKLIPAIITIASFIGGLIIWILKAYIHNIISGNGGV